MNKYDLSDNDTRNVKKLLLAPSTEEKVLNYLSSQDVKQKAKPTFLMVILSLVFTVLLLTYVSYILVRSIYGENYFDLWMPPLMQKWIFNCLIFIWWTVVLLLIFLSVYEVYLLSSGKKELISCKVISDVVRVNYFLKILGWVVKVIALGAFIVSGYWAHLIIYLICLGLSVLVKWGTKRDLKEAIENLNACADSEDYKKQYRTAAE